jgi:hypothetical protein
MPWWAQAGHEYLRGDGTWTGGVVGWPAIDDDRKPSHPTHIFMLQKRPSPHTISKDFESDLRFWGEKHRPEIRAKYRRRMRELVARLRRQREEEQKAGLPGPHGGDGRDRPAARGDRRSARKHGFAVGRRATEGRRGAADRFDLRSRSQRQLRRLGNAGCAEAGSDRSNPRTC